MQQQVREELSTHQFRRSMSAPDAPVRLAKRTSNLFRDRVHASTPGLDVSGLAGVVSVDVGGRTADVQGFCTYEDLVDVTLARGLIPLVVPQLRTITLGGAVAGLGIDCRYCHTSVEVSGFAGMPTTETCMNCHRQIWTNADLLEPVRSSFANDDPIEWQRVHDLP